VAAEFMPTSESVFRFWHQSPDRVFYSVRRFGASKLLKGYRKMNTILKTRLAQIAGLTVVSVSSASAAVDASVTTALGAAGTDAATVGAAVLVVIVGIFAFKLLRKAL